ncbi:hypothetical protein ACTFIR_001566 [Dictyostelium discoideum]
MPDTNTSPKNNSNDENNFETNNGCDKNEINNCQGGNNNDDNNNNNNNNNNKNNNDNDNNNNNNKNKNDDNKKNNNDYDDSSKEDNSKNESIDKEVDGDKTSNSHHNHEEYHETPDSISYSQEQKQNHLDDSPQNHQQQQQEQKQHFHHPKNRHQQPQHHEHQQQQQQHQQQQQQQQQQQKEESFNLQQFKQLQMQLLNNQKPVNLTPPQPPPEIENVPQTFLCWVHCGHSEIKEEIKFENVWRFTHLRPFIKIAFGVEQLSPYIQMYNNSSLNSKSLIDPETLINDPNNLPNNIYFKVLSPQQINSALFLGISNYSISNNFNNYDESNPNQNPNNNDKNNHKNNNNNNNNIKVRVFSNDFETQPALEFQSGIDMNTIGKNFNIVGGWLKKKGDLNSQRVKSPFNSGDYVLVGSIPIHKTITIIYHGFFSYFDKNQNVKIKYSDTQMEISEKILNTFGYKTKTKFQLLDISGGVFIDDLNFADLSDEKAYELKTNIWFKLN